MMMSKEDSQSSSQDTAKSAQDATFRGSQSDESLRWEDFFGSSVDISSTLLDMYDRSVSKEPNDADSKTDQNDQAPVLHAIQKGTQPNMQMAPSSRPRLNPPAGTKLHLSLSPLQGKDCPRPLSSSSLSSSSSSSSSSPRRDSKKLYLASIESLDDEYSEECPRRTANSRDQSSPSEKVRSKTETVSSYEGSQTQSDSLPKSVGCAPVQTSGSRDSTLSHTDRVILEIVETERTYVQDLQEIIQGYLRSIPENAGSKVDIKSLTDLFCNIEDIWYFNSNFLQDLEMCGLDSVAVARCFFKHSYGFAIYTQYCTNYPRTVSILTELMRNSDTAEVFKERQIVLGHNLPLGSYLLKPVQRILRYRLLLENIVKTSNDGCEGYVDIKNALSVMTGIAYHINDMKKRHENAVRVQEIQSLLYGWNGQDLTTYGELVAEGAFRVYRTKTLRHLFLFDKMLLIAKKKEEGILCYKTHIKCSNLMLIESIQGEPFCFHVIPFDNPREQHTFQARNAEQKREWCLQLKRVILENYNAVIPSHARQLVMELGQSKQEDSVCLEKSSSRRQLSAPEYLEKRKQERRKSESSVKPFKIKKGAKKGRKVPQILSSMESSCEIETHQSLSASYDAAVTAAKESAKPQSRWRRASVDVIPGKPVQSNSEIGKNLGVPSYMEASVSDSEKRSSGRFPFSFKSHNSEKEKKEMGDKQQKCLLEETTDTENDDFLELKPPPQTLHVSEETDDRIDVGGEYVTFYFANSHARRHERREMITPIIRVEDNYDDGYCTLSPNMFLPDPTSSLYAGRSLSKASDSSSCSNESNKASNIDIKISADYDNLVDLWTRLGSIEVNDTETDNASECSVSSPALRRVHSFTGMGYQSYLMQSPEIISRSSFVQGSDSPRSNFSILNAGSQLSFAARSLNPPSPAPWLSENECAKNCSQKSVSLPWSFHSGRKAMLVPYVSPSFQGESAASKYLQIPQQDAKKDERNPPEDLVIDLERYIKDFDEKKQNSCFPVTEMEYVTNNGYSSRACSLYDSTTSMNSSNLNHRIYQQEENKPSCVKNVLCNMSSKLTAIGGPQDISTSGFLNCNRSSTCDDNFNKTADVPMSTKFVQSLGKAYSAVMKPKPKSNKSGKTPKSQITEKPGCLHKLGSSVIGARVAHPLDSEYCLLDNFLPLRRNTDSREETSRPDSLLSASSNVTSSSDSDRMLSSCDIDFYNFPNCTSDVPDRFSASSGSSVNSKSTHSSIISLTLPPPLHNSHLDLSNFGLHDRFPDTVNSLSAAAKDVDSDYFTTSTVPCIDSPSSDGSDVSGDSYYEKTFEAIESALAEEMFRDSAIYSDPDELDVSALTHEQNLSSNMNDGSQDADKTENSSFHDYASVLNLPSNRIPLNSSETVSPTYEQQSNNLFTRPINRIVIDRLECLTNQNCQKNTMDSPSLKGLKSITQRRKELEQWQGSTISTLNYESNNEHFPNVPKINCTPISDENSRPKGKGWVKHVVNKLQNEAS